jgi:hypothetical protein
LKGKTFLFASITFDTNGFISSVVDGNISSGDWEPEVTDSYTGWVGLTGCHGHYNQHNSHVSCSLQIVADGVTVGKEELDLELTLPLLPTIDFEHISDAVGVVTVVPNGGSSNLFHIPGCVLAEVGSKKIRLRLTPPNTSGVTRPLLISASFTYHL